MGKSQFIRNASIAILVLGVAFVGISYLKKPIKSHKNNLSEDDKNRSTYNTANIDNYLKNSFEENKTLQKKYISVAAQIEAFIKKQKTFNRVKVSESSDSNNTKIIKTQTYDTDIIKSKKTVVKKSVETKKNIKAVKKAPLKKVIKSSRSLPKLAIIMDDVGFYEEIEKIKKVPFPITPSIFPPNDYFPDTPEIARNFKHYMVHFPMEAYKYKNINEEAIKVSDKIEVIDKKVKQMQKDFPKAIAINNHTGSKYTCNFDAMEQFFSILNKYDINFIDSRTSSGTQCQEVGKLLNKKVLERDVFLDNRADVIYIKNQLREAVKIAKKNGQAIAICHPKDMTFEALMSCGSILKDVEVVYINELL